LLRFLQHRFERSIKEMKKLVVLGVTLVVLLAIAGTTLAAGTGPGNGSGQPITDGSNPVSLAGTIVDTSHYAVGEGPGRGEASSYLLFRTTDGKEIRLVVGPSWYLDSQGLTFAAGDAVTVTGWYEADGDLAVASVATGGKTITLRDADGRPLWSGTSNRGINRPGNDASQGNNGNAQPLRNGSGFGSGRQGNPGNEAGCDGTCPYCTAP
jgi:hypothetical protein